jgi:hypothetical protein
MKLCSNEWELVDVPCEVKFYSSLTFEKQYNTGLKDGYEFGTRGG